MRGLRAGRLLVSTTALVATLGASLPDASAQTLFDVLFRNKNQRATAREAAPPPPAAPAVAPRVSGPSYYTYKTEPLVRVDFAAIRPERKEDAAAVPAGVDRQSVGSTQADTVPASNREPVEVAQAPATADDVLADALAVGTAVTAGAGGPAAVDLAEALVETAPRPTAGASEPVPSAAANAAERAQAVPDAPRLVIEVETGPQPLTDGEIASLQDFELLAEKDAAAAIVAHYSAAPDFLWVSDGKPNAHAREALRTMGEARSHGLDPRDYAVAVPSGAGGPEAVRFEMELSARLLRYVRDARNGRVDPNRISGYHDFEPKPLDLAAILGEVGRAEDVAAWLDGQHPQNDRYKALRVELEALRASAENEVVIAPKTLIRPGETNAEFPKLLGLIAQKADAAFTAAHGEVLNRHLGSVVYAQELVPVVKAAQKAAGLGDDGIIGARTIQALAGESKAGRIAKVEVALEQLRWLPSDFGDRYVFLNAASFDATYVEDRRETLTMRTVVGGLGTQTYFFQDEIEYVEFHPYWGVPRSILVNKYLPKLYSDPGYLDRNGFEVVNSRGQAVSSTSVNWGAYGANIPFDVRQRPGKGNALGEMKIMFPNRHAIYMHDTPDRHLFDRDNRALSNGCVRLADPRAMAAAVLGWSRDQVDRRVAGQHGRENLPVRIPVYVTYFTAWPNEAGEVAYYNDVYSRDEKMRAALDKIAAVRAPGA